MIFHTKHTLLALALITQCYASSSTSSLNSMMDLYKQRRILFTEDHEEAGNIGLKFKYTSSRATEIDKNEHYKDISARTAGITKILKDPDRVSKTNYATPDQKKAIFQAIMAGAVVHDFRYASGVSDDGPFYIPHYKLEPDVVAAGNRKRSILADANLQKHFDVIEQLQKILMIICCNGTPLDTDYTALEILSGVNKQTFTVWLIEAISKHKKGPNFTPPTPQPQQDLLSAINHIDKTTLSISNMYEVPVVFIASYGRFNSPPYPIRIRLNDKDGRQRYIVIQLDDYKPNTPGSPHIVLSHAIINGNAPDRNVSARIRIVNGENDTITVTMDETGSVNTHPVRGGTAYSPDNMHIKGLPSRALNPDEIYSFVTRVDGDGKKVDTLHIVTGGDALTPFLETVQGRGWGDVGVYLTRLAYQTEFDPFLFKHVKKMIDFAGGNIPTDAA